MATSKAENKSRTSPSAPDVGSATQDERAPRRTRPSGAARGSRQTAPRTAAESLPPGLGPVNAISGAAAVLASVSVILIAAQSRWTFTFADGLFWGGVVGFIALRAVAARLMKPELRATAQRQWSRRALLIGAAAVALWFGAQSVQSRQAGQALGHAPVAATHHA